MGFKKLLAAIYQKLLFGFLILLALNGKAQFSMAAQLILNSDYEGAKNYYLKVLDKDSTNFAANQELGLLLVQYFEDKETSLFYLDRAVRHTVKKDLLPELYLGYAQALHYDSQYRNAIEYYEKVAPLLHDDEKGRAIKKRVEVSIENCKYAIKNPPSVKSRKFRVKSLGKSINTPYQEFLPMNDTANTVLLYTTRRNYDLGGKKDGIGEQAFGKLFYATNATGKFEGGLPYFKQNYPLDLLKGTADNDDVLSYSHNQKNLIICRNELLYLLRKQDTTWSEPVLLPEIINKRPHFEGHACVCNDGKTIYFCANLPGTYGGKDIYKITLLDNGSWDTPEHPDDVINSDQDEDGLFLSADENTLYFSSKNSEGYGGYDIFKSTIKKGSFSKPVNLGLPLNSPSDDIYFYLNSDETEGYMSSTRKGGVGDLDIYHLFYVGKPMPEKCNAGYSPNPSMNPYIDFSLRDSVFVNDSIVFDAGICKAGAGSILNYFWRVNDTIVSSDTTRFSRKFTKEGKYDVSLEVSYFSDDNDNRQEYCVKHTVTVFSPKIIDDFFEPLVKKNEDKLTITGTVDVATMKIDKEKKEILNIKLEPVFFSTNKSELDKDATTAIKRNIAKMKVDPTIVVKLTAHTDPRSSKEYNITLSQKRANSVVAFLEKSGIKKKRIIAVLALGEEGANIANCGNDPACQEKVFQQNRRVEFKIVGAEYQEGKIAKAKPAQKTKGPAKAAKKGTPGKKK
ncbi:MAG: OmpA family protein [Bacteroidia bacterium]